MSYASFRREFDSFSHVFDLFCTDGHSLFAFLPVQKRWRYSSAGVRNYREID